MYYWKPFNRRRLMKFYEQFVPEGSLCFDIGAHVGNRSATFAALGARVIAVDPQPVCIAYLNKRFGQDPNITIVEKAVAEAPGHLDLHISHKTPTITTASDKEWRERMNENAWYEVQWEEVKRVEAITLDNLIEEYGFPHFCKIDVENYEAKVLAGLSHAIPMISFEYFPPHLDDTLGCFDRLEQLGNYVYNWSFGESQVMQSDQWIPVDEMRRIVAGYSRHSEYGDVYARLI